MLDGETSVKLSQAGPKEVLHSLLSTSETHEIKHPGIHLVL